MQTRTCRGNMCGGNIATSPYDNTNGDVYGSNYDENFNTNVYSGSNYDSQRTTTNRYGVTQRPQYGTNLNPYDTSDYGQTGNGPSVPGLGNDDYSSPSNIYGSDRLRGNPRDTYNGVDDNQPLFGDLESSYDDSNPFGSSINYRPQQKQNVQLDRYGNINSGYENQNSQIDTNNPYQNQNSAMNRYGNTGNMNPFQNSNSQLNRYGATANNNPYQSSQQNQYGNIDSTVATDPYQNQYDPTNLNSYNDLRATTQRPYGGGSSYTTSRNNFFDTPSSSFDNGMNMDNSNDPNDPNAEDNYCQQKPIPYARCNSKRIIIKNYWFYDAEDGQCKLFTADNCDKNKNKFFSLESCQQVCALQGQSFNSDPTNMNQGYGNGGYDQSNYGMQRPWAS